jgi:hypothetical protein
MFITRHRTDIILLFVLLFLLCFLHPSFLYHSDHPVSLAFLYHFFSRYSASSSYPSTQDPRVTNAGSSPVSKHCNTSNACNPQSNLPVKNILLTMTEWMPVPDAWWKHLIRLRIVCSCSLCYIPNRLRCPLFKDKCQFFTKIIILLYKIIHRITNRSLQIIGLNIYTSIGQSDT